MRFDFLSVLVPVLWCSAFGIAADKMLDTKSSFVIYFGGAAFGLLTYWALLRAVHKFTKGRETKQRPNQSVDTTDVTAPQ